MPALDSLPARPLDGGEITALNDADAVELVVPVDDTDAATKVLLATEAWVKGLTLDGDDWRVVESVSLDGTERYEALRECERALQAEIEG